MGRAQQHGGGDGRLPGLGHCSPRSPRSIPAPRVSVCCSEGPFLRSPRARVSPSGEPQQTLGSWPGFWRLIRGVLSSLSPPTPGTVQVHGKMLGRDVAEVVSLGTAEAAFSHGASLWGLSRGCPRCEDGAPARCCAHPSACADTDCAVPAAWGHSCRAGVMLRPCFGLARRGWGQEGLCQVPGGDGGHAVAVGRRRRPGCGLRPQAAASEALPLPRRGCV